MGQIRAKKRKRNRGKNMKDGWVAVMLPDCWHHVSVFYPMRVWVLAQCSINKMHTHTSGSYYNMLLCLLWCIGEQLPLCVFSKNSFAFLFLDPPASPLSFTPLTSPEGEHIFLSVWHNQFQPSSRMSHFSLCLCLPRLTSLSLSLSVNIYVCIRWHLPFNQSNQSKLNHISVQRAGILYAVIVGNEEKETYICAHWKWHVKLLTFCC